MAASSPRKQGQRKRAATKPSRKRSAVAAAPSKATAGEDGTAIRAELLKQIEGEVGRVERKPNKAKTYERLFVEGRSIGYVFMPRPSGVQIRIPERFSHLEPKMPSFEYATTDYGFWFTLKSVRDVPKVAKAFRLAADDVRAKKEGSS